MYCSPWCPQPGCAQIPHQRRGGNPEVPASTRLRTDTPSAGMLRLTSCALDQAAHGYPQGELGKEGDSEPRPGCARIPHLPLSGGSAGTFLDQAARGCPLRGGMWVSLFRAGPDHMWVTPRNRPFNSVWDLVVSVVVSSLEPVRGGDRGHVEGGLLSEHRRMMLQSQVLKIASTTTGHVVPSRREAHSESPAATFSVIPLMVSLDVVPTEVVCGVYPRTLGTYRGGVGCGDGEWCLSKNARHALRRPGCGAAARSPRAAQRPNPRRMLPRCNSRHPYKQVLPTPALCLLCAAPPLNRRMRSTYACVVSVLISADGDSKEFNRMSNSAISSASTLFLASRLVSSALCWMLTRTRMAMLTKYTRFAGT